MRTPRILALLALALPIACSGSDELSVSTTSLSKGTVGASYSATLAATGGTEEGYKWAVTVGEPPAGIDVSADGKISGTPTIEGDSSFTVQVTDSDGATASQALTLTIDPVGTGDPQITTTNLPGGEVGIAYSATLVASGGAGGNTWSVSSGSLPDGLSLSGDGAISGTPTTVGSNNVTIQVEDSAGATDTAMFTIVIAAPTSLTITTTMLPNGVVGMAYSATVESQNGMGTITWLVSAGALPDGLSIDTTGANTMITGTPSMAETASFTLTATDDNRQTTRDLTIEITGSPQPLDIVTMNVPTGTVGVAYSATIVAQNGSNMGYAWSVTGTLPDGLMIDAAGTPATTVTGIPTASGNSVVTIEVRDTAGNMASRMIDFSIRNPPLSISPGVVPGAGLNQMYSATLTASGGSGTGYTWNLTGGNLPAGITLTDGGATATLAGTPSALGVNTFDIQLTDDAGGQVVVTYTIQVYPPLAIDTPAVPNGYVNTATVATLSASGGSGMGYMWSISAGTTPPGMTLTGMGTSATLGGTPTMSGTFRFTVQVIDSAGLVANAMYTVDIYEALAIATLQLPTATTAVAYSANIAARGGAPGALTWTQVGGTLPDGLTLGMPAGNSIPLAGVPTTLGQYTFSLRADDSYRGTNTATIAITVYQPLQIDTVAIPAAAQNVTYSATIVASGGSTTGYTWVASGNLPGGLQLLPNGTPSTTLTGQAGQVGAFTFTVTVMDSNGEMATQDLTLDVVPPLQISTVNIPGRAECAPGITTIVTTGGSGSGHMWTVSAGALPTGWTVDPTGSPNTIVSGRANASGMASFTLTVTDDGGLTDSQPYVVNITADANAQRNAIVVGDIAVNNDTSVFLVDVCGDTPGPLVQLNPTLVGGDAPTTSDLASFSPDGSLVSFVGDFTTDTNVDLYIVDPSVNPPVAVNLTGYTQAGANVQDVFWAPNSNLIVFIADAVLDGRNELFLVDVTNPAMPGTPIAISGALAATGNDVSANDVFWSPNSQRIVFHADADIGGVNELYYVNVINPAAPTARAKIHPNLAGSQDCEDDVFWAPNSQGVLFRCDIAALNQDELWFSDFDAQVLVATRVNNAGYLAANDIGFNDYRFAPAGVNRAFYQADEVNNASEEIWVATLGVNGFGAPARAIAAIPADRTITHARWSPGGTRLAFRADLTVNDQFDLYVVDVSGALPATPTRISNPVLGGDLDSSTSDGFAFGWSPNGQRIAYIADQTLDGVDDVYIAEVVTQPYTSQAVTSGRTDVNLDASQFYWSGDSQWLAVRGDWVSNSVFELLLADVSGAGPYTAVAVNAPLAGGQDVSSGAGSFFFRRDNLGLFFESDMVVDNDTETWMVDFSTGMPQAPVVMNPMLPTGSDVSYFYVEP